MQHPGPIAIAASQPRINRAMTPLEWVYLIALSLLWGGSFFLVELGLRDLPPFSIVFARLAFGTLGLLVIMFCIGERLSRRRDVWLSYFCLGFFNNAVPFCLLVWGQTGLTSSAAAILNATTPFFTLMIAHLFTADEKMTSARLLGIGMGVCGVAVMLLPDFGSGAKFHLLASFACLGAALSYGCAGVYARRVLASGNPLIPAAVGQVLAATILLLPVMLLVDRPWNLPAPPLQTWGILAAMGLLSTSIAYVLYFRVLSTAGATNLSLVTLLIPVSATLLGVGILKEHLLLHQLAGMALIGLGLITIDGRLWRRLGIFTNEKDRKP